MLVTHGTVEVVVVAAEAPVPLAADTTFRARRGMGFMPSRLETQGAVGRGLGRLEGASEVPAVASEGVVVEVNQRMDGCLIAFEFCPVRGNSCLGQPI